MFRTQNIPDFFVAGHCLGVLGSRLRPEAIGFETGAESNDLCFFIKTSVRG
jgi:hypothetical protein